MDALKAAWMVREFGIKLYYPETSEYQEEMLCISDMLDACGNNLGLRHNIPPYDVHPDCYKMLNPQEGDLIKLELTSAAGMPEGCSGIATNIFVLEESLEDYLEGIGMDYMDCKIIQRNGKAFFMPETGNN
jgi:hypothetical protein